MIRANILIAAAVIGLPLALSGPSPAHGQADQGYLGDIIMAGPHCPDGWAPAQGQMLMIASNPSLFAVITTVYGGDGQTTFALPDFRGRIPVHYGDMEGQAPLSPGMNIGAETVVLTEENLPEHRHALYATSSENDSTSPASASFGDFSLSGAFVYGEPPDTAMASDIIGEAGQSAPFPVISTTTALMYCINTDGAFPPRG